jgi:uncharacterized membrane protein YoaK (UPF0700 family)
MNVRDGELWQNECMTTPQPGSQGPEANQEPAAKKPSARFIGMWLAIGAGMGAAMGVAGGDIAMWLPVGIAVGLALGVGIAKRQQK